MTAKNLGDFLKRTSLVVVHGSVDGLLASPQHGVGGRRAGVKTRGEPFPEITLVSGSGRAMRFGKDYTMSHKHALPEA